MLAPPTIGDACPLAAAVEVDVAVPVGSASDGWTSMYCECLSL